MSGHGGHHVRKVIASRIVIAIGVSPPTSIVVDIVVIELVIVSRVVRFMRSAGVLPGVVVRVIGDGALVFGEVHCLDGGIRAGRPRSAHGEESGGSGRVKIVTDNLDGEVHKQARWRKGRGL